MYTTILIGSGLLVLLATPAFIRLARATNLCDAPGVRKVHRSSIPLLGGAAIAATTLAMFALALAIWPGLRDAMNAKMFALLGSAVIMLALGLVDDWRSLRARNKLFVQLLAAVLVCMAGVRIDHIQLGSYVFNLGILAWPVTILWIVGLTNAVNLIDGLDGLAAGVSAIASAAIAIYALAIGQIVPAALLLALSGSLVGFLYFNFNPAKIFLGDAGAYFVGFVLSAASVVCIQTSGHFNALAVTCLALGVPVCDVLFSMLRRVLQRRSIFAPDREHIHHRLLGKGLSQRQAVLAVYGVTILLALLTTLLISTDGAGTVAVLLCGTMLLVMFFRAAGAIRLRDSILAFKHNVSVSQAAGAEKKRFELAQLRLREAGSFQSWWYGICTTADELGFVHVSLRSIARNGKLQGFDWSSPSANGRSKTVRISFPVSDRRRESRPRLLVDVQVNDSLEAVGRQAALFGRLIDECGLQTLTTEGEQQQGHYISDHSEGHMPDGKPEMATQMRR